MGLGFEDILHKNFASAIKQRQVLGLMKDILWTYNASGERRTAITGALLKAKGLSRGWSDYIFIKKSNGKN